MKVFRDFQTRRDARPGIMKSIFNYLKTYFSSFPGAQNASLHPERPQGMLKANSSSSSTGFEQQRPLAMPSLWLESCWQMLSARANLQLIGKCQFVVGSPNKLTSSYGIQPRFAEAPSYLLEGTTGLI